jgi:hypothetical protein
MPHNAQTLNNAEIADRLTSVAQLLSKEKPNPYKIRAYRRAASTIRGLGESVDELVRMNGDLRVYAGIGEAIDEAVRKIVLTGTLASLEKLRSNASPELVEISAYPRLDAKQRGCFFEINSSPDRLDVSSENARLVKSAGILISISTDSHSTPEFGTIRFGIEQARRRSR